MSFASGADAAPVLRRAMQTDLPALLEIEGESFAGSAWPPDSFLAYDCLVAELGKTVAGFLVSRRVFHAEGAPPEREILNLAVAKQFRRLGIATCLLRSELATKGVFFLEVRESNTAAHALYEKLGFLEIGRRRDYYEAPSESAIVMQAKW